MMETIVPIVLHDDLPVSAIDLDSTIEISAFALSSGNRRVTIAFADAPIPVVAPEGEAALVLAQMFKGDKGDSIVGPPGPEAATHIFQFPLPTTVWTVNHGLGKFPSVTLVDSAGDEFQADIKYADSNTIIVTIGAAVSGAAYLN